MTRAAKAMPIFKKMQRIIGRPKTLTWPLYSMKKKLKTDPGLNSARQPVVSSSV
jgi:hypothetical protein